ncbi:hypothetical protein SAMN05660443_0225 [Marinospirillum celere]|uniref:HTH cro/C1-type domain-containing protein n=1 Tax=Marinospirillum celere TaxID=1122252 RepID=A0A1I1DZG1_9GAMM|nr:helix-turn-helix domain-containing protein [Marinospirillum celere]SFB80325.1 hypothetical protein SAMN05660443_0225 [Marinospirillum celere]
MSPLKKARVNRGWKLADVVQRLRAAGESIDTGNLSRIERGLQRPSTSLAESLCFVFEGDLNEIHVLYPERFIRAEADSSAA